MKDGSTQFSEFTIDISKIPADKATQLETISKDDEGYVLDTQAQQLAIAANNYTENGAQDLQASALDSDRYKSLTIVKADGTEIIIEDFSKKAREHYGAEAATMDMLVGYLKEKHEINISDEQKQFLKEQWHQSGPPSIVPFFAMQSVQAFSEDSIATKMGTEKRVFHIDSKNNLTKAEYKVPYKSFDINDSTIETGQSADFTVSRDFKTDKTSLDFKSTGEPPLGIAIDQAVVETLGPAIKGTKVQQSTVQNLTQIENSVINVFSQSVIAKLNKGRAIKLNKEAEDKVIELVQEQPIDSFLSSDEKKKFKLAVHKIQNQDIDGQKKTEQLTDLIIETAKKIDIDKFITKNKEQLPTKTISNLATRMAESAKRKATRLRALFTKTESTGATHSTMPTSTSKDRSNSNSRTSLLQNSNYAK